VGRGGANKCPWKLAKPSLEVAPTTLAECTIQNV